MELHLDLERDSNDQLIARARNAKAVWLRDPESPRGQQAARVLELIEAERDRRSIDGAITAFLEEYPGGFDDPRYRHRERDDKVHASTLARTVLARACFSEKSRDELALSVKQVLNETNLVQGSFEKPKFLDALQDPSSGPSLLEAIRQLLHGEGDDATRLASFADHLHTIGLRKWTYATYFLFLMDPGANLYVKPESIKKAADIAGADLGYDPAPTAEGYARILAFARWIERRLVARHRPELVPKDFIDIQSFIWFMAPTGKFAKA